MRLDTHIPIHAQTYKVCVREKRSIAANKTEKSSGTETRNESNNWKPHKRWEIQIFTIKEKGALNQFPIKFASLMEDSKGFSFGECLQSYAAFTVPDTSLQAYIM